MKVNVMVVGHFLRSLALDFKEKSLNKQKNLEKDWCGIMEEYEFWF